MWRGGSCSCFRSLSRVCSFLHQKNDVQLLHCSSRRLETEKLSWRLLLQRWALQGRAGRWISCEEVHATVPSYHTIFEAVKAANLFALGKAKRRPCIFQSWSCGVTDVTSGLVDETQLVVVAPQRSRLKPRCPGSKGQANLLCSDVECPCVSPIVTQYKVPRNP